MWSTLFVEILCNWIYGELSNFMVDLDLNWTNLENKTLISLFFFLNTNALLLIRTKCISASYSWVYRIGKTVLKALNIPKITWIEKSLMRKHFTVIRCFPRIRAEHFLNNRYFDWKIRRLVAREDVNYKSQDIF